MNRIVRIVVSSLALVGALSAVPAVASAEVEHRVSVAAHDGGGVERGRHDWDRDAWTRWERDRVERERVEHARACDRAYETNAPRWELRQMGCWVR